MLYKDTFVKTDLGIMPIESVKEGDKVMCFDGNYRTVIHNKRITDNYIFDIILHGGEILHLGSGASLLVKSIQDNVPINSIVRVSPDALSKHLYVCYKDSWDATLYNSKLNYQHNYILTYDDFYKLELANIDTDPINNLIEAHFKFSDKSIFVS